MRFRKIRLIMVITAGLFICAGCGSSNADISGSPDAGSISASDQRASDEGSISSGGSGLSDERSTSSDSSDMKSEDIITLDISGNPASKDGVTVTLDKATAVRCESPSRFEYSLSGTIKNDSDEGVMRVIYTFAFFDASGEEFRSFGEVYDGLDKAIPPHTSVDFSIDDFKYGAQSVPASVEVGISTVQTERELPPAKTPQEGDYLYQALDDEKLANIKEEPPVSLSFHVDRGGYGRTAVFEKGDRLDKALELFCNIRIGKETGEWVTDNYNWIGLTWADGSSTYISLNLYNLEYFIHSSPHVYELEGLGEFWSYASDHLIEDE